MKNKNNVLKELGLKGIVFGEAVAMVFGMSGCSCANRNGQEVNQNIGIEDNIDNEEPIVTPTVTPIEEVELTEEEQEVLKNEAIEDINNQIEEANVRLAEIEAEEAKHAEIVQAIVDKKDSLIEEYKNKNNWDATEKYILFSTVLYNSNFLTVDEMMELLNAETFEELINHLKGSGVLLSNIIRANVIVKTEDELSYYEGIFDSPDIAAGELPVGTEFLIDEIKNSKDDNAIEYVRILNLLGETSNVASSNGYTMDKDRLEVLVKDYTMSIYNLNNSGYFKDDFILIGIMRTDVGNYYYVNDYFETQTGIDYNDYRASVGAAPRSENIQKNYNILNASLKERQTNENNEKSEIEQEKVNLNQLIEELNLNLIELQTESNNLNDTIEYMQKNNETLYSPPVYMGDFIKYLNEIRVFNDAFGPDIQKSQTQNIM